MVYRNTEIQTLCVICSSPAPRNCKNCQAPHCSEHLLSGSCASCSGQLWALECKQVRRIATVYGVGAVPIATMSLMLAADGAFAFLGFTLILGLLLGFLALPKIMRPLFRRLHARKVFPATSQRMLPPVQTAVPVAEKVQTPSEAEYDRRRRNNRRPVKPKTSVLGSFYKIR